MKKLQISLLAPFLLLAACQQTKIKQTDNTIPIEAIESVANDFFKALGSGDTTLMMKVLTNDFEMFEHDQVWNTDSLLSLMPNTLGREWSIENPKVSQDGNLIHLYYFNQGIKPEDRSWYESMLMESSDDLIRIKFMHSTKLY